MALVYPELVLVVFASPSIVLMLNVSDLNKPLTLTFCHANKALLNLHCQKERALNELKRFPMARRSKVMSCT